MNIFCKFKNIARTQMVDMGSQSKKTENNPPFFGRLPLLRPKKFVSIRKSNSSATFQMCKLFSNFNSLGCTAFSKKTLQVFQKHFC